MDVVVVKLSTSFYIFAKNLYKKSAGKYVDEKTAYNEDNAQIDNSGTNYNLL